MSAESKTRRVLVVDDEPGLREMLAANLELDGFEVVTAESAERGLEIATAQTFDLVLTDIRMPGMNGVEMFRKLRELGRRMPVVLMTGFALEELVQGALEDGAFTVLPKPFDVAHALEIAARAARGPTVLVVDDVKEVAEATSAALEASGLKARAAHSGDEALEVMKSGGVDLCVVDLVMPGMSGAELVSRLRALPTPVAVIAVSGEDVPALIRDVATLGMHTFMRKPVGARELTRNIAAARGAKHRHPGGARR